LLYKIKNNFKTFSSLSLFVAFEYGVKMCVQVF